MAATFNFLQWICTKLPRVPVHKRRPPFPIHFFGSNSNNATNASPFCANGSRAGLELVGGMGAGALVGASILFQLDRRHEHGQSVIGLLASVFDPSVAQSQHDILRNNMLPTRGARQMSAARILLPNIQQQPHQVGQTDIQHQQSTDFLVNDASLSTKNGPHQPHAVPNGLLATGEHLAASFKRIGLDRHAAQVLEEHAQSAQRKRDSIERLRAEERRRYQRVSEDVIPGLDHALSSFQAVIRGAEVPPNLTMSANARAMYNMGVSYAKGHGVPHDLTKAAECYANAASLGHVKAMYNLGVYHTTGMGGVPQDWKKAADLFEGAAQRGFVQAQRSLGICYAYGKGRPVNTKEAVRWLKRAADQGDANSRVELDRLAK